MPTADALTFKELFEEELKDLEPLAVAEVASGNGATNSAASADDRSFPEPYTTFVSKDLAGICLSGGGIRSATFNLGLLDGLAELGLIGFFHYLATVSGGGYIGGWWSAWLKRDVPRQTSGELFPPRPASGAEPKEIRHLREFSNFLSPRVGFLQIETWLFVSSVIIASLPSLIAAAMILVVGVLFYLVCAASVIAGNGVGTTLISLSTFLMLLFYELETARRERDAGVTRLFRASLALVFVATAVTGVTSHFLRHDLSGVGSPILVHARAPEATPKVSPEVSPTPTPSNAPPPDLNEALHTLNRVGISLREKLQSVWPWLANLYKPQDSEVVEFRFLWLPLFGWIAALLVATLLRLLIQSRATATTAPGLRALVDRVLARLVAFAVVWLAGLLVLNLSLAIRSRELAAAVSGSGLSLGLVASYLLKNFVVSTPSGSQSGKLQSILRVLTPQILAYLALLLIAAGVAHLVIELLADGASPILMAEIAIGVFVASAILYNPNEMGLHPFYRGRIARAYLGASNFLAPHNRQVTAHAEDDIPLGELAPRPFHLVCTAANDLSGDGLATLNRGARSGTLSRQGFAVGNRWWKWEKDWSVTLASALTASGAAVNPNMGSYSKQLGGAVTFLLAALNVRLGLWLRTARTSTWSNLFPGWMFYREIFSATRADDDSGAFHLSDGGHFENLGLYELIRRRCRYILVSDCGADPNHQFEDLGNALRRVREDFAVEIDIDLAPLALDADKIAQQHIAVGDVFYPGGDRGVILYIKPVLAGGEPDDVLQYSMRNSAFPHETTGDQFYDEAQWESYRRLGLHAARTIFRFVQGLQQPTVDDVFGQARLEWYAAPPGLLERSIACAARRYDIEKQLLELKSDGFLSGTYPELPWGQGTAASGTLTAPELAKLLPLITQMMQLLDDVYVSCNLKQHWNHPLNVEWMNTFGRWFTAPIVLAWWPILSPMFNRGAIAFARERFGMPPASAYYADVKQTPNVGVATQLWQWMGNDIPSGTTKWSYLVHGRLPAPIELAVAFVRVTTSQTQTGSETTAHWNADEFFVPPSFWGAGIGRHFLPELLSKLKANGCQVAIVDLAKPTIRDESRRKEQSDLMQMYRERDFDVLLDPPPNVIRMRRQL